MSQTSDEHGRRTGPRDTLNESTPSSLLTYVYTRVFVQLFSPLYDKTSISFPLQSTEQHSAIAGDSKSLTAGPRSRIFASIQLPLAARQSSLYSSVASTSPQADASGSSQSLLITWSSIAFFDFPAKTITAKSIRTWSWSRASTQVNSPSVPDNRLSKPSISVKSSPSIILSLKSHAQHFRTFSYGPGVATVQAGMIFYSGFLPLHSCNSH